jgi:LysM repeat protein
MSAVAAHTGFASTPSTRLHLTRRGRAVFTTLAAIPLVVGALGFALNGGIAAATGGMGQGGAQSTAVQSTAVQFDAVKFDYATVQSGQSLWELAESIAPTADPRDVIADIVSLNRLQSEDVQPGQRLALPAGY